MAFAEDAIIQDVLQLAVESFIYCTLRNYVRSVHTTIYTDCQLTYCHYKLLSNLLTSIQHCVENVSRVRASTSYLMF